MSRSRNGGEHSSSPFRERNVTEQQTLNWKGRLSHDPLLEESLNEKESPYSRSAMPGGRGMTAEYWFLLPVGCTIAVLAMSSGVSAGNFWVPVYLLWARFDGPLAFWMTLATMLCGYGSGVARNLRQGTIHRSFIVQYLPLTIPAAIIGGYLSPFIDVSWLILLFGVCVFAYGARMLAQSQGLLATPPAAPEGLPWGIGVSGGVLYGLITVGLGELMLPRMLADRKLSRPAEAVGSAVLIIFVTSVAAALVRLNRPFVNALVEHRTALLGAILFAGPGVILGGQLGPRIARQLNARALRLATVRGSPAAAGRRPDAGPLRHHGWLPRVKGRTSEMPAG